MSGPIFCAVLTVAMLACFSTITQACDLRTPPGGHALVKANAPLQLAYTTEPGKLETDKMFSVVIHLCSEQPVERITVDAHMPEHRHGMNYKPVVTRTADGSYQATGFLFHMPGKWEFVFEARVSGKTERFTHAVMVE